MNHKFKKDIYDTEFLACPPHSASEWNNQYQIPWNTIWQYLLHTALLSSWLIGTSFPFLSFLNADLI